MTQTTHAEIKEKDDLGRQGAGQRGQDDFTRGHISFRLPDNPKLFFMKCHSLGLDEITHENILTIDLDGKVVAGTTRRHSEVYIHSEIFKVRPDVHCILHTHLDLVDRLVRHRPAAQGAEPAGCAVHQRAKGRALHRHHQPDPLDRDGRAASPRRLGRTAW